MILKFMFVLSVLKIIFKSTLKSNSWMYLSHDKYIVSAFYN